MGVTINTNIASLMVQLSLKQASADLDLSLQQLTTGYRINSAKDDAAGYTISQNILTKLRGYAVAQNNTSMGLSLINTATDSLDLISNNLSRLRNLVVQARTGTYGPDSISSMNKEAENIVLEMERIRNSTEYNGIKIFEDKTGASQPATTERRQVGVSKSSDSKIMVTTNIEATESDTLGKFVNFGGGNKTVNIKDKNNAIVTSFSLNANTTVAEMQQKLRDNGINSVVSGGVITLMSTVGNYVEDASSNGAMTQMGISVLDGGTGTKKAGVISTSNSPITYTSERFAVGSDKLGDVISLSSSQTINVYDSSNNITATKSFSSNNTIDEVLSFLNSSNLTASINNGVISITSADGHYVKDSSADGILSKLGIGSNTTGSGSVGNTVFSSYPLRSSEEIGVTRDTRLDVIWSMYNYNGKKGTITIKNSSGVVVATTSELETLGDLIDFFNANGITTTFDENTHKLSVSSDSGNYYSGNVNHGKSLLRELGLAVTNVNLGDAIAVTDGGVYYLSSQEDISFDDDYNKDKINNVTYILTNNIDITTSVFRGDVFNATLYGNGYVLKMNESMTHTLFDNITSSHIYDLGVENLYGCFISWAEDSEFVNCYVTGKSSRCDTRGGFVERAYSTTFTNCYSTCTVTNDKDEDVGGFVGYAYSSTFNNCYATGDVIAIHNIGGFVGSSNCSTFDSCYATGNVSDGGYGFVGDIDDFINSSTIKNCYSSGSSTSGGALSFAPTTSSATITNSKALSRGEAAPFTYSNTGFMTGVTHAKVKPTGSPRIIKSSNNGIYYYEDRTKTGTSLILASGTIYVLNNGVENTISISFLDTFDSLIAQLANQGITASLTGGIFKINGGSSTSYVKSIDSSLESALKLSGPYYSTSGSTTNNPSNAQKVSTASNVTELTKFSDLGISSNMTINTVSNGVANTISVAPATTMSELLQMLRNIGFTASLSSGKLTIKGSETSYIESMDSALENVLKISGPYYTASTITTKTNSNSNKLTYTDTIAMNDNTTLAELGITSNQTVIINQNKTDKTISLSKTDSLATMLSKFSSAGISGYISDGKLNINASDSAYIKTMPSVLKTALKLSGAFSQEKEVTITPGFGIITGGHVINLQVGVDASPESVISFDTSFSLVNLATILANGLTADDLLDKIDATIATVTAKQTMLGAIANRLDSVLESLNINYMNQSSALSTIRDVDIAQVSSKYIRSMILSQASASLLTTANQSPNIALTLIRGFGR